MEPARGSSENFNALVYVGEAEFILMLSKNINQFVKRKTAFIN